jgi:hypothetical protein
MKESWKTGRKLTRLEKFWHLKCEYYVNLFVLLTGFLSGFFIVCFILIKLFKFIWYL